MKKIEIKTYIIIFLLIVSVILFYDILQKKEEIKKQDKTIENLNKEIDTYKENELLLKDDKLFYKDLYIKLANDYNNRLQELGINEYILTDTSR